MAAAQSAAKVASDLFAKEDRESKAYDASSIEVLEGLEPVRKRPGMYIGGTDERALHHLVAEVLDNSMDEAVAGHASRIEVELLADGACRITDNGRGVPIDPHPRYPGKSALEVILTTLHSGGKFSGKAYETSGGLHGVGVSVVNALSDHLVVEVARDRTLWRQAFSRGTPEGGLEKIGPAPNRRGTSVLFHPDPEIFGPRAALKPARLWKMARSKAYLFGGVEIRWKCAADLIGAADATPAEDVFHFPGGLSDFLAATLSNEVTRTATPFAGKVAFSEKFGPETAGSVEWAIAWTPMRDAFVSSYCNTVPTPEGGTHEAGFRAALTKGVRAYGELIGARKAAQITGEDLFAEGCAMISAFIREPDFVGQTKDRLSTTEAQRLVEGAVRDHWDNWLAADPKAAGALIEVFIERAEDRMRRRKEKETARKTATKKLRLPGKLVDCSAVDRAGTEIFLVEGDSAGGSAKMARDRKTQALLPLRGKILNVLGAASSKLGQNQEIADLCQALGVGMGARYDDEDLRYERVIIMTDADVDGAHIASLLMTFFFTQMRPLVENGHLFLAQPPLYRLTQGGKSVYAQDEESRDRLMKSAFSGRGKIDVSRFKGLGEMDAKDLKDTTMNAETRRLIRVAIDDDEPGETAGLVERLMGKKPELRFDYIQANARFAEALDI
ncbi:DNA topoisomerase IV subunit B [Pikeienuella piscinae]|uniref:DNA topoisomerase 4 subunit B n=1 Tax=Pikeienuella piscinae TaxID=2748098 RepID=A0A7L5BUE9_9RHOB|nr:DNA topoisomerase IV subunit B [Pikeienuella piscinae]QIE54308.1 DNA topoisomerase IV subunit B [Pikeienuella piscinae]